MDAKTLGATRDRIDTATLICGYIALAFLLGRIAGGGL